jgi:hypothetical protein
MLPGTINADHWACDLAGAYHKRGGMLFDQGRKCGRNVAFTRGEEDQQADSEDELFAKVGDGMTG